MSKAAISIISTIAVTALTFLATKFGEGKEVIQYIGTAVPILVARLITLVDEVKNRGTGVSLGQGWLHGIYGFIRLAVTPLCTFAHLKGWLSETNSALIVTAFLGSAGAALYDSGDEALHAAAKADVDAREAAKTFPDNLPTSHTDEGT